MLSNIELYIENLITSMTKTASNMKQEKILQTVWYGFALYRTSENKLIFNFRCLDDIIEMLHDHDLMPGFEMMGNPSGYFTDLEDHSQIMSFADLAFQLASRYIGSPYQYYTGNEEVMSLCLCICALLPTH